MFSVYPWEACSLLKGNGEGVDLGDIGGLVGGVWEEETEVQMY